MIKKEFKEILLPVVIRLLIGGTIITLTLVFLYYYGHKNDGSVTYLLEPALMLMGIVIIWIANSIGVTAFTSEYKDNAFEYLLSSPYSKLELFYNKIIPRLLMLFSLSIPYAIFDYILFEPELLEYIPMLEVFYFLFFSTLIFLNSFFLSLFSWKNLRMVTWVIYVFPAICTGNILLYLHKYLSISNISDNKLSDWFLVNISLGIIAFILGLAFYLVFRKFDLKSESIHKKKFGIYAGVPLVLIVVVGIIASILYNS
jgi:hypothetical protein